jgi:hypothetical protein
LTLLIMDVPLAMIAAYLHGVRSEAERRGYCFDAARIVSPPFHGEVEESEGQLLFEWTHLLAKLAGRAPGLFEQYVKIDLPGAHPLFRIVAGEKREWERG